MDFGIAAFPQKSVQDKINSYRKRYDAHYSLIPPHITLRDKFELKEDQLEDAVLCLEKIAKETSCFKLNFNKVSHFYPTSNTIYLAIDNPTPLIELHDRIDQEFGSVQKPYEYQPHLTIGQKMEEQELHDVYGRLRMNSFDLETEITRFHLMYQLENEAWNIYQTFLLSR
ncbi:2'-5' RNA ligase family protein [Hazenella sp. IB182357]|uniref:Putative phosphoesterase IC620_02595 n=1 Tax=Polycladospora coralii TaxID=2771432 RepID=A0A926N5U2_9BACL|nr:2'-5' RNA ligase family protein [Polycladospora coralii]MBD1371246.1 2'-5' RNA ligase family protein [Polycladospora coralii]MBS7530188.1 2'-5' RNA ligase family protein [Polycladospora coralii]